MNDDIDIGRMISGSTADVSVSDLSRRGFKKVKVLNQEAIKGMVMQAVERVLAARREEISRSEREKVVEESRQEFDKLMRQQADAERQKASRVEEELEKRVRQVTLLEQEVAGLREERDQLRGQLEVKTTAAATAQGEVVALQEKVADLKAELDRLRAEHQRAADGGQEVGKKSAAGMVELTGLFRELITEMRTTSANKEQQGASELKASMEMLADRIARSVASAGGGGGGGGGAVSVGDPTEDVMAAFLRMQGQEAMESNIDKVGTKQTQTKKGVAGSLEKLKSMQRSGGNQGGS
jgi:hypothetical protein